MKLGIRSYLLIILGALCAAPMLLLSTITARRASATEMSRADSDSWARANAVARELDQFLSAQVSSVELLAGHVEAVGGLDSPHLQSVLSMHRQRTPQLSFCYIANKAGKSLYTDPPTTNGVPNAGTDYSDRDYYHEVVDQGRTAISGVQLGRRSGVPNVQVATPIRAQSGELVGFAEGSIDLKGMSESIASVVVGAHDSRVVITDASNRVLADSAHRLAVLGDVAHVPLFEPSPDARYRSTADERGVAVRAAIARTQRVSWTITVTREQSSVEALAYAARRDALVITIITLLAALAVVALGVHWLSKPIRRLAAATTAVGYGDFTRPVPEPRRLESTELAELLGSVRDMTERVRDHREEASALITRLETMNDQLRTMVVGIEHAGNAIEVADAQGKLIYVNPAWEELTGYTADEVLGRSFIELIATEGSLVIDVWAQLVKGLTWHGVCATHKKDGAVIEIELDAVPVMRDDGTIGHVVATRVDLTEKRRAEEVLRMNDRLAAVGTLAAGVAHEINNPLTYVTANLGYLRQILDSFKSGLPASDQQDVAQAFREAMLGVERVTDIVRDLKQLSRTDEKTTTEVDINNLLESSIRMANLEIRHRAAVECSYGKIGLVRGNEARLAQVFLNILINAAQACDLDRKHTNVIRVATRASDDNTQTIVEISDTGKGIEPEVIDRIFDAFFTTKPLGVGTGLGLSICHGIVTQLGGTIDVDSTPGVGSTFRVKLPAVARPSAPAVPPARTVSPDHLRILVVDDEATLATALKRMLRDHAVTIAGGATDALDILAEQQFDVVVSDIMMPGLNGFELYERICATHPEYAKLLIFMTGGIIHPGLVEKIEELGAPCLYKPFSRDALLEMISSVVRATPSEQMRSVAR